MTKVTFLSNFKQKVHTLEHQAGTLVNMEDITHLKLINTQLQREIDKYKQLINGCLNLLWEKKDEYNRLLVDCLNSSPLNPNQYQKIAKKFNQLDCDIEALNIFIKHENPQETFELYDIKLKTINDRINALEKKTKQA
ncbi:Uncharacterised protein [Legionella lansingensis]|uniref:Coiled-coil protein n=1 Tax=Legionella lansingensis TaxID=45067 RepID=A0A0W0VJI5_9GAMM|nr:hypothetical protein [Legionella lansingensis]KTD20259.1 hypothetical protein Llan_1910 [Legionella lansingensis]SNV50263.1 Uncharacterised protein [Legionella lansingensis]